MLGPVTNERRRRRVRVYENRAQRAVSIYLPGWAKHKKSTQGSIGEFFYLYFLIILQNYATVLKFIRFDTQPPWPTTTRVRSTVAGPTGGKAGRRDPWRLRPIRRAPRRQAQPPWAHGDRVRAKPPLPLHYTTTCVHTQFIFSSYYT
jgi:hypothetical protein